MRGETLMAPRATNRYENKYWLLAFCYLPKANSKKETLLPSNKGAIFR